MWWASGRCATCSRHCLNLRPRRMQTLNKIHERFRTGTLDLEAQKLVGARTAEVDHCDGFSCSVRLLAEAVARVGHQRRAHYEHRIRMLQRFRRSLDALLG